MIGDKRFFQYFFDGQIVKPEEKAYKIFKLVLVSVFSLAGLVLLCCGVMNWVGLILLICGMLWNVYLGLDRWVSYAFSIVVGVLYFYFAVTFNVFANALIYVAFYIPLQLIAISKDYSEGSFVQIRKGMSPTNRLLFFMLFLLSSSVLILFSSNSGGRFVVIDALAGTLLLCSAFLRNERYLEYYWFRMLALAMSILLWILVILEYGDVSAIAIVLMYASYMVYDATTYFVQHRTYVNQYMIQVELYKQIESQKEVKEKLKVYKKSKAAATKN